MTTVLPEQPTVLDELLPMPETAEPVVLPGLLSGVGVITRRVPAWITDPDVIQSILDGHYEIPDDLNPQEAMR